MSKYLGGGFPGIKLCIDEKNLINPESIKKKEFSVRKIIPINQILTKKTSRFNSALDNLKTMSPLKIREIITYKNEVPKSNTITSIKSLSTKHSTDIEAINKPLIKRSKSSKSKK